MRLRARISTRISRCAGSITCGDCCKPLTACWSTSKTGKKDPYYLCYNCDCTSYRKSIPRDRVEGEFETLLHDLRPAPKLFDIVRTMFRTAWDARLAQAETMAVSLKREAARIEKQIAQLVDRIVDSESATAIAAYERRIAGLERDKLTVAKKLANGPGPRRTFEEMFELAMTFLATLVNYGFLIVLGQVNGAETHLRQAVAL